MDKFAWPIVVLILAIVFMILFRQEIRGILQRARKVGPKGIEADSNVMDGTTYTDQPAGLERLLNHQSQ